VEGYAARFGVLSRDLGGWREKIQRGAFADALKRSDMDVVALFNHDQNQVLGRTSSGTLTVREDSRGLFYRVTLPDTGFARDLVESMARGDIHQSSFAFTVPPDGSEWKFDVEDKERGTYDLRIVKRVAEIFDVSPVTTPAYPDATSGLMRSFDLAGAAIEERRAARREFARAARERVDAIMRKRGIK
jgi:HK97 family phage prohead protease